MANPTTAPAPEIASHAVPEAADDPLTRSASPATGAVRFSMAGHEFVVIQDAPLRGENGSRNDASLSGRPLRVAGCLCISGETYTIFSLDAEKSEEPGAAARSIDVLTQRELQIATLVMQGRVNKQIAYRLHIAPNTVQSHLKRIFCKLGVNSRAAMVAHLAGCFQLGTRRQP